MNPEISPEFPFESNFIDIDGSNIHYVDVGEGDPILFLHGNVTWSYLWRNIIPHLQPEARCIAPDMIGMGKSDKPDIDYRFEDHYGYIKAFIDEMGLEDITVVGHDWGSGLGFHYAHTNPDNVTAIAFLEAIIRPLRWNRLSKQNQLMFRLLRAPVVGWIMIGAMNTAVNQTLPRAVIRDLTEEELEQYRMPYPTVASRRPVRVWPREVPLGGKPARVHNKVAAYGEWLTETGIPKLCLYAHPGVLIPDEEVRYIESNFPNTTMVDLGEGLHWLQEDHPHRIGEEIASWHTNL